MRLNKRGTLIKVIKDNEMRKEINTMEERKVLNEEELNQLAGGDSKEEERKKEIALRGSLYIDGNGNYVFTDKHNGTAVFTPDQWNGLKQEWAYTGDPEWWMRTLDVGELKNKLA